MRAGLGLLSFRQWLLTKDRRGELIPCAAELVELAGPKLEMPKLQQPRHNCGTLRVGRRIQPCCTRVRLRFISDVRHNTCA